MKTIRFLSQFACGCTSAASFASYMNDAHNIESVASFLDDCEDCDGDSYIDVFSFNPSALIEQIRVRKSLQKFIYTKFPLELEKNIVAAKMKILHCIDSCFQDIRMTSTAFTLKQAEVLDDYGSDEDFLNAGIQKTDRWQQLNLETINDYIRTLIFLNEEGFVFHIPAFMQWSIIAYDMEDDFFRTINDYSGLVYCIERRILDEKFIKNMDGQMILALVKYLFFSHLLPEDGDRESLAKFDAIINAASLDVKDICL
jgi:hypothetical protein